MSSNYWQTKKQNEQLINGNTTILKVKGYIQTWKNRCYSEDIPDNITDKLIQSGRVPSYKAITLAILKNDLTLKSLGFEGNKSKYYDILKNEKKLNDSDQMRMF